MPAKNRRIRLTPTKEFLDWFEPFAKKMGMTDGEALAFLCKEKAEELGFNSSIMNGRGTYERELAAAMQDADAVTDFGRNDPAESDLWNE